MVTEERRRWGRIGEDLAAAFIAARGHVVVSRNYRCRRGEIDLIFRDGSVLVFCEVRTRRSAVAGQAVESVTRQKQIKVLRVARHYLAEYPRRAAGLRFDVVAIDMRGSVVGIAHVVDAFRAD